MAKSIILPQVGQDLETAVIVEWHVKEGDHIQKGDIVAIVESDKAIFEVEAFESGTILKLLYEEGDEGKVLQPIALIGEPEEKLENGKDEDIAPIPIERDIQEKPANKKTEPTAGLKQFSTPSARRIAREYNVDLSSIRGSGPAGRILKKDVLAFVESHKEEPVKIADAPYGQPSEQDQEILFSKMRQGIADRLVQSKQTIPHFYLFMDVDMTAALAWRAAHNRNSEIKITVNDLIVKGVARALEKFPRMNAHVASDRLIVRKDVNVGMAVTLSDGLVVPVIQNADRKNIYEISTTVRENATKAKTGVMKAPAPATFTVSNLGMYDIDSFLPIINPPECAILGVGNVKKQFIPLQDHSITVREMMKLSLACDHRAVDGTYAAQFLKAVRDFLKNFQI